MAIDHRCAGKGAGRIARRQVSLFHQPGVRVGVTMIIVGMLVSTPSVAKADLLDDTLPEPVAPDGPLPGVNTPIATDLSAVISTQVPQQVSETVENTQSELPLPTPVEAEPVAIPSAIPTPLQSLQSPQPSPIVPVQPVQPSPAIPVLNTAEASPGITLPTERPVANPTEVPPVTAPAEPPALEDERPASASDPGPAPDPGRDSPASNTIAQAPATQPPPSARSEPADERQAVQEPITIASSSTKQADVIPSHQGPAATDEGTLPGSISQQQGYRAPASAEEQVSGAQPLSAGEPAPVNPPQPLPNIERQDFQVAATPASHDAVAFGHELAALANARDVAGIAARTTPARFQCPGGSPARPGVCAGEAAGSRAEGYAIQLAGMGELVASASQYLAFLRNSLAAFGDSEIVLRTVSESGDTIVLGALGTTDDGSPALVFSVEWLPAGPVISKVTYTVVTELAGNLPLLNGGAFGGTTFTPILPPHAGTGMVDASTEALPWELLGIAVASFIALWWTRRHARWPRPARHNQELLRPKPQAPTE